MTVNEPSYATTDRPETYGEFIDGVYTALGEHIDLSRDAKLAFAIGVGTGVGVRVAAAMTEAFAGVPSDAVIDAITGVGC